MNCPIIYLIGCDAKNIPGFCGGGGIVINMRTLRQLTRTLKPGEFYKNCALTEYVDITLAWSLKQLPVEEEKTPKMDAFNWTH